MSAPRRFTQEDLALFAMQLLSKEEAAEVSAWLEQSEEARRELAEVQGDLAIYAHTVDLHSPPAQARERLLKQVSREKKAIPIDRPAVQERPAAQERPGRSGSILGIGAETVSADKGYSEEADHSLVGVGRGTSFGSGSYLSEDDLPKRSAAARVFPWVGWAVAAGLAVMAGNLYHERENMQATLVNQATKLDHLTADAAAARQVLDAMTDSTAMRVTLNKGTVTAAPQGRAIYVPEKGTLIFVANNLDPLPADKAYELWLIPTADKGAPIPAGTFHPDARGNADLILPPLPKGVEAKAFGVTIEDKDGATTPTMPIILAGA
jgi:NTP pyrophosphatase (non-canonical NTP hydrolase)